MSTNSPFTPNQTKIALIGGGTGSFTLLSALKNHTSQLAALVNMADDGGSTGLLRDELGALPPGDVRQCLVALSRTTQIRDLFNYRFEEGSLKGHAFGNLFLTALEKMTGDFATGVQLAGEVLNIIGSVEPITLSNVRLVMTAEDGNETQGEFKISNMQFAGSKPKFHLKTDDGSAVTANPRAVQAIYDADMVVIAPGNLYGSLAPALVVPGIGEALEKTSAFKAYVCNLVTKPGQTDGYTVMDFASEVERMAGSNFLDAVLFNTEIPSDDLLKKYAQEGEMSVGYDTESLKTAASYTAVGADLLSGSIWRNTNASDPIASSRTLIRHDSETTAAALMKMYDRINKK